MDPESNNKKSVYLSAHGVTSKSAQSSSVWSGLISHLRSSVTVKRRRVHLKSHSDCFLGSEAADVVAGHIHGVKGLEGVCLVPVFIVIVHIFFPIGVFEPPL